MMLSEYTTDFSERQQLRTIASVKGKQQYAKEIESQMPSLLDLLTRFPSCNPPLDHLIDTLPGLKPRYYSVSNSPMVSPNKIEFAFTVVDFELPSTNKRFKGICSNELTEIGKQWIRTNFSTQNNVIQTNGIITSNIDKLVNLSLEEPIQYLRIFPRIMLQQDFSLPPNDETPIIMVGPGTGVAPFRAFLQHRRLLRALGKSLGDAWLFYGCRHRDKDFLYREELESYESDGSLTKLITAYSRETEEVVYVQDRLFEYGELVEKQMVERNAVFYVCGDAKGMAMGVRDSMLKILHTYTKKTEAEAAEMLLCWQKLGRYVLDVWA